MSSTLDTIDNGLKTSEQNIIGLTEPDNDVYPLLVELEANVQIQMDLKIESQAMSGDSLIWGHTTRGMWGTNKWSDTGSIGFILGSTTYGKIGTSQLGSNSSAYTTVEELINV